VQLTDFTLSQCRSDWKSSTRLAFAAKLSSKLMEHTLVLRRKTKRLLPASTNTQKMSVRFALHSLLGKRGWRDTSWNFGIRVSLDVRRAILYIWCHALCETARPRLWKLGKSSNNQKSVRESRLLSDTCEIKTNFMKDDEDVTTLYFTCTGMFECLLMTWNLKMGHDHYTCNWRPAISGCAIRFCSCHVDEPRCHLLYVF
jgi:hypothetical protein